MAQIVVGGISFPDDVSVSFCVTRKFNFFSAIQERERYYQKTTDIGSC